MQEKQAKPISQGVTLGIQVPLSAQEYEYLEANAGGKPPAEKLAAFVKWFISRQARGGLMLEPEDCDYLAKINKDTRFATSKDVVRAVEVALKREDGQYSFTIAVDPEYIEALEQQAQYNGTTVDKFLEHVGNSVLNNGWYAEFTPTNGCLTPISESDLTTARRVLGKFHFTGTDLAAALLRLEALEGKKAQAAA